MDLRSPLKMYPGRWSARWLGVVLLAACAGVDGPRGGEGSACGGELPDDCYVMDETCVLPSFPMATGRLSEDGIRAGYEGRSDSCEPFGYFECAGENFWVSAQLDPGVIRADYIEPGTIVAWSTMSGESVAELAAGEHGSGSSACVAQLRGDVTAMDCLWSARKTVFERWENGCRRDLPADECEPCDCRSNDMWGWLDDDC